MKVLVHAFNTDPIGPVWTNLVGIVPKRQGLLGDGLSPEFLGIQAIRPLEVTYW